MFTFCILNEIMEQYASSPLMDTGEETKKISVIKSGESFYNAGKGSFWDDFISLCGDTSGLSELLGVRPEQVSSWPSKIRDAMDKVEKHDMNSEDKPERSEKLIPTGQNGAITSQNINQNSWR